jgi:hypothetical protein
MLEESGIPQLNLDRETLKLAWDARARITWGDAPDDVKQWLLGSGVSEETANQIVATCMKERSRALRGKGLRDLLIGGCLMIVSAGVAFGFTLSGGAVPFRGIATLWAFSFIAFMFGVHLTWRGAGRLLVGGRSKGAVSDVDDLL